MDSVMKTCQPTLSPTGWFATKGPGLVQSYAARKQAAWPSARGALMKLGKGDEKMGQMVSRLPDSALLWHAGHRWFYLEVEAHRFERRDAGQPRALRGGEWLVPGLASGARVVTTGAQSLLGEELRWSIPTEDDD